MVGYFIYRNGAVDEAENGLLAHRCTVEEAEEFAEFCRITEPDCEFVIKKVSLGN